MYSWMNVPEIPPRSVYSCVVEYKAQTYKQAKAMAVAERARYNRDHTWCCGPDSILPAYLRPKKIR